MTGIQSTIDELTNELLAKIGAEPTPAVVPPTRTGRSVAEAGAMSEAGRYMAAEVAARPGRWAHARDRAMAYRIARDRAWIAEHEAGAHERPLPNSCPICRSVRLQ